MQEFGGFEIKFMGNVDIGLVKTLIEEMIDGTGKQIHVDENRIYMDNDSPIAYDDFDSLFERMCKKTALAQPKSSFNGIACYSNLSIGLEVYQKSSYRQRKKVLIVESICGEYLDGCCPECGVKLFIPIECKNQAMYHCSQCDKDFKFDFNYRKNLWVFKNGEPVIQNN